jgi:hypothetical protein
MSSDGDARGRPCPAPHPQGLNANVMGFITHVGAADSGLGSAVAAPELAKACVGAAPVPAPAAGDVSKLNVREAGGAENKAWDASAARFSAAAAASTAAGDASAARFSAAAAASAAAGATGASDRDADCSAPPRSRALRFASISASIAFFLAYSCASCSRSLGWGAGTVATGCGGSCALPVTKEVAAAATVQPPKVLPASAAAAAAADAAVRTTAAEAAATDGMLDVRAMGGVAAGEGSVAVTEGDPRSTGATVDGRGRSTSMSLPW